MNSLTIHLIPLNINLFFFFFLMIRRPPRSTLSLHDALPIFSSSTAYSMLPRTPRHLGSTMLPATRTTNRRSEEHTSELQSRLHLVCRLLLEKKKKKNINQNKYKKKKQKKKKQ